ncbi:MAG: response regulator [Bacteroidia bacterium]|nr:response regulator [Bacteroidia bacterium]
MKQNIDKNYYLVEDQLQEHDYLMQYIEKSGFTCVKNFLLAKELIYSSNLSELPVDLIISDIQMPVMSGIELAKHIRDINVDIPILLISHGFSRATYEEIKSIPNTYYSSKDPSLLPIAAEAAFNKKFVGDKEANFQNWIERNDYYQLNKLDELPAEQKLSDFEVNIIKLLGEDYSLIEIANILKTSKSNVSHTITRMTRRLKLNSNKKLVMYGVMYGHI